MMDKTRQEKLPVFLNEDWAEWLMGLEMKLRKNKHSKVHLVGGAITLADIAAGAFVMRMVYNSPNADHLRFARILEKYPLTKQWANDTIFMSFKDWWNTIPPNGF